MTKLFITFFVFLSLIFGSVFLFLNQDAISFSLYGDDLEYIQNEYENCTPLPKNINNENVNEHITLNSCRYEENN